ncbi:hypothetical protein D3C78_837040 [compost metagenome]
MRGKGGTGDQGAGQVDIGQARLSCTGIDLQPLAAAAGDHILKVDVTHTGHRYGGAVLVVQHAAAQVDLADVGAVALQAQGRSVVARGAHGRLCCTELATVPDQHAMGLIAGGNHTGLLEGCRAWRVADQHAVGTDTAGAGNAVLGQQFTAALGLQADGVIAVGADAGVLEAQGGGLVGFEVTADTSAAGIGAKGLNGNAIGLQSDIAGFWCADASVQAQGTVAFGAHRYAIELHAAAVIHGRAIGLLAGGQQVGAVGDQQRAFITRGQGMREGQVGRYR